jgi:cytochrome P450
MANKWGSIRWRNATRCALLFFFFTLALFARSDGALAMDGSSTQVAREQAGEEPLWCISDPALPPPTPAQMHWLLAWGLWAADGVLNQMPTAVQNWVWQPFAAGHPNPDKDLLQGDLPELAKRGLMRFVLDRVAEHHDSKLSHDAFVRFRLGPVPTLLPLSPATALKILQSGKVERGRAYNRLVDFFGYGIFTSKIPERWKHQRDTAIRLFHPDYLEQITEQMYKLLLEEAARVSKESGGQSTDLVLLLSRMGLLAFCDTVLGVNVRDIANELSPPINRLLAYINGALEPIAIPFGPAYRSFIADRNATHRWMLEVVRRVREAHKAGRAPKNPLVDEIVALDNQDRDAELVELMISTVLGGHETTARLMLGALYSLMKQPRLYAEVRAEADKYLASHPGSIDFRATLEGFPRLRTVVEESLRLYPPVWLVARSPKEEFTVDGETLKPGTVILISPLILQRQTSVWGKDAEVFRPERFDDLPVTTCMQRFFPFVAGPERCPGRDFAKLESVLAIAGLLHHFDLKLVNQEQKPDPTSAGTFRLFRELAVTLTPRSAK